MALVCDNPSFIFVHIYKCAGMSVRSWLNNSFKTYEVGQSHSSFAEIKNIYEKDNKLEIFNKAFKFTFIRNPFDWTVSLYFFIRTTPTHEQYKLVKDMAFPQFCEWLNHAVRNNKKTNNGTYFTLTEFLYDSEWNLLPTYIGKVETFSKNIREIKARLGAPHYCPHINITKEREKGYNKYYDEPTRKLIKDLFEFDFKLYGL